MQRVTILLSDDQVEEIRRRQRPDLTPEDLDSAIESLLDDFIASGAIREGRQYRRPSGALEITVANTGSKHHDISIDHDRYLSEQ